MKYITYIILIAGILFLINNCSNQRKEIARHKDNIRALKDSTSYFKNKLGQTVATKLALQLTEKELKEEQKTNASLKIALKKFKKPIVVVQTKQVVKIDTIYMPFKDSIQCVFSRENTIKDKYYNFNLKVDNKGSLITDFKIEPNNQTLVVGHKKTNFFKSSELRVDITNSNPYVIQKDIKPFVITYKRSWHEKGYITIPVGIALGLLVK